MTAKIKLNKLKASDYSQSRASTPSVTLSKNGNIFFNRASFPLIEDAKTVTIYQDETRPVDFYMEFGNDPDGFKLHQYDKGKQIQCKAMVHNMFRYIGIAPAKTTTLPLGTEPIEVDGTKVYAIITKAAQSNELRKGA
jgi:hypothetical protein